MTRRGSPAATAALAACLAVAAAPLAATLVYGGATAGAGGLGKALGAALASPSTARAIGYGLRQAVLSTLLALALGLPGAWLVARHDFPGKKLLRALQAVPFCVPPVLVVLAFVLYYGRGGVLNAFLMSLFSLDEPPVTFLFSLAGLILVHGFYNFPIVLETVGSAWEILPRRREEAARTLGAKPLRAFLTGTLPALRPAIAQSASLVFLFCFFSFVVVLVFGPMGGTTLEVEIYRAARIEADPVKAAALALVETAIALAAVSVIGMAASRSKSVAVGAGERKELPRPRGPALAFLLAYGAFLALFFAGPLFALVFQAFVVKEGMAGGWSLGFGNFARILAPDGGRLFRAVGDSLSVALPAALAAVTAGSLFALAMRRRKGARIAEAALSLPLAVSGVITALGWSIIAGGLGKTLVVAVLALTALPFAQRSVAASLDTLEASPAEAARSLGATRLRTALEIELPAIAPALLSALAFSFSMAAGDASAPLLLGSGNFEPLPLLIYRLVSAYRFPEACAAGLVLALLAGVAFFLKDRSHGSA